MDSLCQPEGLPCAEGGIHPVRVAMYQIQTEFRGARRWNLRDKKFCSIGFGVLEIFQIAQVFESACGFLVGFQIFQADDWNFYTVQYVGYAFRVACIKFHT
jgi:hypothetical protein